MGAALSLSEAQELKRQNAGETLRQKLLIINIVRFFKSD